MSFRTAYGNVWSENGWRMCNRDECDLVTIDGADARYTRAVIVRKGPAHTVLRAFLTLLHREYEPIDLYKADVGDDWGWSLTNDVGNSNHLSGTAVDYNATRYPWKRRTMTAEQRAKVRELRDRFNREAGIPAIFWGGEWATVDEMHWQIGVPEFDPDGVPNRALADWAARLEAGALGLLAPADPDAFPLPREGGPWGPTWFFGPLDGPEQSVSGQWAGDTQRVKDALGRWQAAAGVPVTKVWDEATKRAAQAIQMANGWQPAPGNGFIYEGEWNVVVKDGQRPDYSAPVRGVTYADVSQWQSVPVDETYPHRVVMFRANNGNEVDRLAAANLEAARRMVAAGKLDAFGVYAFWRPNEDTVGTLRRVVGEPHPRMFVMLDVESAKGSSKGEVRGDQSAAANAAVDELRKWLGGDRVMGYWNQRADPTLWPHRPAGVPFVVPDYSATPGSPRYPYEGSRVHQYTDRGQCPPWKGGVDLNYFSGTLEELLGLVGLGTTTAPESGPTPGSNEGSMTTRVAAVTGPGTSAVNYGVGGTDLGIARKFPNGRTAVVLGDTFEQMTVGGPGWRSPVILFTDDDTLPELADGVTFNGAVGGNYARQLWAYTHDGPPWTNGGFSTVLPSDVLVVGNRVYLFVSVCRGLGDVRWTEIQYSDDNGQTWVHGGPGGMRDGNHEDGFQRGITWERAGDWVYILGSRWLTDGGGSNVRLWRVHVNDVMDRAKWQAWGWNGSAWGWGHPASDILPGGTKVREMNLRYLDGQFVWVYTQTAPDVKVVCKALPAITDNWHTAPTTTVVTNVGWGGDVLDPGNKLAQPYGGYILPGSTLDDLHLLISQWDTVNGDNWPYRTLQFKHKVHSAVPRPAPPVTPPVTPPAETLDGVLADNYRLGRALAEDLEASLDGIPAAPPADHLERSKVTRTALIRVADKLNPGGM